MPETMSDRFQLARTTNIDGPFEDYLDLRVAFVAGDTHGELRNQKRLARRAMLCRRASKNLEACLPFNEFIGLEEAILG